MTNGRHERAMGGDLSPEELRDEIARTRARLSEDIEQVRAKLSPKGLEHEARSALRGVSGVTSDALSDWSHAADRQASRLGAVAVDFVKRHPVATTMLGLGIAWLAARNGRGREQDRHVMTPDETALIRTDTTAVPAVPIESRADLPPPRR